MESADFSRFYVVDMHPEGSPEANKLLTILVPNYNRPDALRQLLQTVFKSISHAEAEPFVTVLVVDDYSETDLADVIESFKWRDDFVFRLQEFKCGNAEVAFLSALKWVETEYVWLLGNDDDVFIGGVAKVIQLLRAPIELDLILLNPTIRKTKTGKNFIPIRTTSETVVYERAEDLFYDFGFVTSTTTFPCLVMKTEPVRQFHKSFNLPQYGNVYSHTFTMFGALHGRPALFLSTPVIGFKLNERNDEQRKLEKQAPAGVMFFHQSIGLTRLVRECARLTGIEAKKLLLSFEDEVNKDVGDVQPTFLSHFIAHFFLEQLIREQENVRRPTRPIGNMIRSEVGEIMALLREAGDQALCRLCVGAVEAYNWQMGLPAWKITFLRLAQQKLRTLVNENYKFQVDLLPMDGPKKIAPSIFLMIPLRGSGGDAGGMPKAGISI